MSYENQIGFWKNNKKLVVPLGQEVEGAECKYCCQQESLEGEFLCSPCACSGTCAMVHFGCLEKWNQTKVKKETVGGTIQYNFEKFYCEVCKEEYPRFIEKNGVVHELLAIERPKGEHLMLEGISEKSNNMIILSKIPQEGIVLGRGNECQIRLNDISVSRKHAKI